MKFLCDRCKTRYSIADERVRGKILKIRCKNCANVISVREGMNDEDAMTVAEPAASGPGSALQSAFASVMTGTRPGETQPPPPVLEEEWYVAIDGNQSGPFTLAEAQEWVTQQKTRDELFCWCEGFDDWLPVEKVSHFRGLRQPVRTKAPTGKQPVGGDAPSASKKTGPTAAAKPEPKKERSITPVPAVPASKAAPRVEDEEPKPLFAATLAKLEAETAKPNGASKASSSSPFDQKPKADRNDKPAARDAGDKAGKDAPVRGGGAVSPLAPVSPRAPLPMPGRGNPAPTPIARTGAQAAVASATAGAPSSASSSSSGTAIPRTDGNAAPALAAAPAVAAAQAAPGKARSPRPMFDTGDDAEPEALDDSALEPDDASDGTDGLDLDIGEVSRVVRLPDLMAAGRNAGRASAQRSAVGRSTGGVQALGRGSGAAPTVAAAAGAAALGNAAQVPGEALPPLSEAVLADAQPQMPTPTPRRNHGVMWLIGGAMLVIVFTVIAVIAISSGSNDDGQVSLGGPDVTGLGYTVDDPRRFHLPGQDGSGSGSVAITGTHVVRTPRGSGSGNNPIPTINNGSSGSGRQEIGPNGEPILPLTGDDIVSVSSKYQTGTRRCYDRALKKDAFLQVSKIMVSLKVDVSGVVTDVSLDSHGNDDLGQCLMAAIRRWPFRRSTEGINTVFPLVFQQ